MGGIDQELHLIFVELLTALAEVEPHDEADDGRC